MDNAVAPKVTVPLGLRGALSKSKRTYQIMYGIRGTSGKIVYIGQTASDRRLAMPRDAQYKSEAPHLHKMIMDQKDNPEWKLKDNIVRLHRVPSSMADKVKCFLIMEYDTIHSQTGDEGCNLKNGPNVTRYEQEFASLRAQLAQGFDLGVEENEETGAVEDAAILAEIVDETKDEEGEPIQSVQAAAEEADRYAIEITKSLSPLAAKLEQLIATYTPQKTAKTGKRKRGQEQGTEPVSTEETVYTMEQFCSVWNDVGDEIKKYDGDNELIQVMIVSAHMRIKAYTKNGETNGGEHKMMTQSQVKECLSVLLEMVKHRDRWLTPEDQSFQSRLAWCQPTFQIRDGEQKKEQGPKEALKKVEKLLGETLTPTQRAKAVKRKAYIERLIANSEASAFSPTAAEGSCSSDNGTTSPLVDESSCSSDDDM
jgi:hypothetical protein